MYRVVAGADDGRLGLPLSAPAPASRPYSTGCSTRLTHNCTTTTKALTWSRYCGRAPRPVGSVNTSTSPDSRLKMMTCHVVLDGQEVRRIAVRDLLPWSSSVVSRDAPMVFHRGAAKARQAE